MFRRAEAGVQHHPTARGLLAVAGCWRIPFSSRVRAGCSAADRGLASQHGCRRSVGASHRARGTREPGVAAAAARLRPAGGPASPADPRYRGPLVPVPTEEAASPAGSWPRSLAPPGRAVPGPLRFSLCHAPRASAGSGGFGQSRRAPPGRGWGRPGRRCRAPGGPAPSTRTYRKVKEQTGKKRQDENAHETRPGRCPRKSPAPRGRATPPPAPPRSPAPPGAAAPSGSPPRAGGSRGTKQRVSQKNPPRSPVNISPARVSQGNPRGRQRLFARRGRSLRFSERRRSARRRPDGPAAPQHRGPAAPRQPRPAGVRRDPGTGELRKERCQVSIIKRFICLLLETL